MRFNLTTSIRALILLAGLHLVEGCSIVKDVQITFYG